MEKKLNNLLSFSDFEKTWKPEEQKKTKRTEIGLDIVKENYEPKKVIALENNSEDTYVLWDMVEDEEGWWGAGVISDNSLIKKGESFTFSEVKVNTELGSLTQTDKKLMNSYYITIIYTKHGPLGIEDADFKKYFEKQ